MKAKTTKFLAVLAVLAMAFAAVAAIMPTEQSSAANVTVDSWDELTEAVLVEEFDVKLGADIDGSDAGAVELPNAGKIDLNGYTLTIDEVTVDKDLEIVSTAAAAAKENESVIIGAVNGEGSITLKDVSMEATVGLSNIYVAGTVEFFGNFTAEATTIAAEGIDATLNLPKKNNETSTVVDGLILEGSELNVTGFIKAENGVALETIDNPATDLVIDGNVAVSTLVEVTGKLTVGSLEFVADAANELYVRNGGVLNVKGAFTLNTEVPFDDRYGIDAGAKLVCESISAVSANAPLPTTDLPDVNIPITFNSYILGKIIVDGKEFVALSFVYENKVYSYFAQTVGSQETVKAPKVAADENEVNVGYLIPVAVYDPDKEIIGFTDTEDSKEIVYPLNSKVDVQSAGMLMYPVYFEPVEDLNLSGSVKYTGPETDESKIVGATIYFKPTEGDTITAVIGEDLTFSAEGFATGTYRITIPAAANLGYVAVPVGAVTFEKTDISGLVISIVKKITVSGTVDVDEDVKALMENPDYEEYTWEIIGCLKDANENVVQTINGLKPKDTYAFKQNYSDEFKLEFVLNGTFDATTTLFANYSESIIFTEDVTKDIILHLPTYAISGIVYDSEDADKQKPVVGLELQLQMQVGVDDDDKPIYEDVEGMTATTDEDGKYVFENVLDKNMFRVVSADEHFVIADDIGAYTNVFEVDGEDLEEQNLVATENNWVVTLYVMYNGQLIDVPEGDGNGITATWKYRLPEGEEGFNVNATVSKVDDTVGTYKIQLTSKIKDVLAVKVNSYNAYGDAYKGISGWDQTITVVLKEQYYNLFGTATITGIGYNLTEEAPLVTISDADATLELYNGEFGANTNTFEFMFTGLNLNDTGTVTLQYGDKYATYAYKSIVEHVTGVQLALNFGLIAVDITVDEGITLTIDDEPYVPADGYECAFGTEITLKATTVDAEDEREIVLTINDEIYDAEETKYTVEGATTIVVSFASQQTEKFVASIADDLTLVVAAYDGGIIGEGTAVVEVYKMIELAGMLIPDLIDTIEVTIAEDTSIFSEDLTEEIQAIISESGAGTYNINASVTLGEITKYSNVVAMTETAAETEA